MFSLMRTGALNTKAGKFLAQEMDDNGLTRRHDKDNDVDDEANDIDDDDDLLSTNGAYDDDNDDDDTADHNDDDNNVYSCEL